MSINYQDTKGRRTERYDNRIKYVWYEKEMKKEWEQFTFFNLEKLESHLIGSRSLAYEERKALLYLRVSNVEHCSLTVHIRNIVAWNSREHFSFISYDLKDEKVTDQLKSLYVRNLKSHFIILLSSTYITQRQIGNRTLEETEVYTVHDLNQWFHFSWFMILSVDFVRKVGWHGDLKVETMEVAQESG